MDVRRRGELTKEEWNTFVQMQPNAPFLQSWQWGDLHKKEGRDVETFRSGDVGAQVVRYSLPFGKSYVYAPRAPIGDLRSRAELMALIEAIRMWAGSSALFLRVDPMAANNDLLFDLGFRLAPPSAHRSAVTNPPSVAVLSIEQREEDLAKGFKSKTRYNVRLSKRHGVQTRVIGADEAFPTFLPLLQETADRAGFTLHPEERYRDIATVFGGDVFFVEAWHDDDLLASLMVLSWGDVATYLFGGSSRKKQELMAPYAAQWAAIKEAKKRGCFTYDFGVIAPEGQNGRQWQGMTRFKVGFGAEEQHFLGPVDFVYSGLWYQFYNLARRMHR